MVSRKEIRELAVFQIDSGKECALTFYFQPQTPQNKSHREEAILAKDLVRNAMREMKHHGKNPSMTEDLQQILQIAENLHGNQARAKAIFACRSKNIWKEFDLPPNLPMTKIAANHRFHLTPLLLMLETPPISRVVLLDRKKARFFDFKDGEIHERTAMFHSLPHRGRSDGWHGYDGGHSERSVNDEAFHHFRNVATHLKQEAEKGKWEKLIVGCLDTNWRDFATQLHADIKKCCLGRFSAVPEMALDGVREGAKGVFHTNKEKHRQDLIKRVLSYAKSHKQGVTGLRRVLRSLELGEVRSLLVADNYAARGVECTSCGRLDAHLVRYCALCGHSTRKLEDIFDAMVPMIVRKDTELVCVRNQELEDVGNIAALLRFRSSNGNQQLAEAS